MLRQVEIHDFRCLRRVIVPLRPLTVLIGPNDSGKSAFLAAIEHLIDVKRPFDVGDYWRHDAKNQIRLIGMTKEGVVDCNAVGGSGKERNAAGDQIRKSLSPIRRFQLPASGVPMQCPGYSPAEEKELAISLNGERTAALLDYLLRSDRKRFFGIVDALRKHIPGLDDINIGTPDASTRRVDLLIENGLQLPADQASAGVRLLLFFVMLAYHPRPPRTILVEEPENGIHPKRLADVVNLLRAVTKGVFGDYSAQILLTTHSPYLLDSIDLNNEQVLVFKRNGDGSRSASPIDADRLKTFTDEFMLGEVWFNEDEAGLVAKP